MPTGAGKRAYGKPKSYGHHRLLTKTFNLCLAIRGACRQLPELISRHFLTSRHTNIQLILSVYLERSQRPCQRYLYLILPYRGSSSILPDHTHTLDTGLSMSAEVTDLMYSWICWTKASRARRALCLIRKRIRCL